MGVAMGVARDSPDSTEKAEDEKERVVRGEGRGQAKGSIEGERGEKTGATTNEVRERAPEVATHHHPQEYDGI